MTPNDFIYNSVYKGALAKGAKERQAKDCAVMCLDEYKKGKMGGGKSLKNDRAMD